MTPDSIAVDLKNALRGEVVSPADDGYDEVRRVWNGMFDRRPGAIARCAGAADVLAAVNHARERNLLVSVRGGGHSFPGYSVCDGGLMIDLSRMKGIRVDPVARRVRAEPGVTWGELDRETQSFGLATTGGMISHTGIAGLTLGGGFGWLARKHGLVIDNLLSADIVTADGRLVHAAADQNPELFWGLRGGGGNFGVVTSFEYRLHPLGPVYGGLIAYPLSEARQVLRGFGEAMQSAPDELCAAGLMLTTPDGHPAVGIAPAYTGSDLGEGRRVSEPLRKLGSVVMEQLGPMPYPALQSMLDASAIPYRRYYMRSNFMNDVSDDAIDIFAEFYRRVPSPFTAVVIVNLGGAVRRVPADATAYYHRGAPYTMSVIHCWLDARDDEPNITWLRELWDRLAPHLPEGVYVNELHDEGADRVRAAYGPAYPRLAALKRQYDPANFFRLNQNIQPAR
jgi:FAD/FMN-containing dehydrogenase